MRGSSASGAVCARGRAAGSSGARACERAALDERAAHGEDDAERHGRSEDGSHAGHDGLDGVPQCQSASR